MGIIPAQSFSGDGRGQAGRHPRIGRNFFAFKTKEQVLFVIDKIVEWVYRLTGGVRLLSEQLDDIHFDKFRKEIFRKVRSVFS